MTTSVVTNGSAPAVVTTFAMSTKVALYVFDATEKAVPSPASVRSGSAPKIDA